MRLALLALVTACSLGCTSGSVTLIGTRRPAIPVTDVRVYAAPPDGAEVIALLESAPGHGFTEQAQRDDAIEDLKEKAAALGANGIVITGVIDSGSSSGIGVGSSVGGHGGVGIGVSRSSPALLANAIHVEGTP